MGEHRFQQNWGICILSTNTLEPTITFFAAKATPGKNKPLTKDGLIKKLNDFISINDRVPTRKEFGQINQIKKIYGSFDAFIRANGYEPLPSRRAKKS